MARHPNDPIVVSQGEFPARFIASDGSATIEVPKAASWVERGASDFYPDQYKWSIAVIGDLATKFSVGTEYEVTLHDPATHRVWNGTARCKAVRPSEGKHRADFEQVSDYQEWKSLPPEPGQLPRTQTTTRDIKVRSVGKKPRISYVIESCVQEEGKPETRTCSYVIRGTNLSLVRTPSGRFVDDRGTEYREWIR